MEKCDFSDESRFALRHIDGKALVWRNPGTRFDETNIIQHDRYGGGSDMLWGAIS